MEVTIKAAGAARKLASGAKQSFPIGWTGDLPEEVALQFIAEGKADAVAGAGSFTAEQHEFLRAFADETMRQARDVIASIDDDAGGVPANVEYVDPLTGEIADVLEDAAGELPAEIDLEGDAAADTEASGEADAAAPAPASGGKKKRGR